MIPTLRLTGYHGAGHAAKARKARMAGRGY
jgi:hypothetical protein